MNPILFASRVFRWSGVYGLLVLVPQYFLEARIGTDTPPPITHPEYFYGFVGVGLSWQVLFLIIATNPVRYRGAMPVGALEKLAFAIAVWALYARGRVGPPAVIFSCIDLALALLFMTAYARTPRTA